MESPFNRPVACNLIDQVITERKAAYIKYPTLCGGSLEMTIYNALKRAGYLTEEAMVKADDEPTPTAEPAPFASFSAVREEADKMWQRFVDSLKQEKDKWK